MKQIERMDFLLVFILMTIGIGIDANVNVNVIIKQSFPGELQSLEPMIRHHIITAVKDWSRHFQTASCTLDVEMSLRDGANRAGGRSFASVFFENQHLPGKMLLDQGASYEIRTGIDPNGEAEPDIEIFFDPEYFRTLWFDPNPETRTTPMPHQSEEKIDAYSIILHEIGHALGFNGFLDQTTGQMVGQYLSVYDRWMTFDGRNFFFHGLNAVKVYGQPIVLSRTRNNHHHVAEYEVTTDANLTNDVMNGIAFEYSRRYYISPLDIAILLDCGLTLKNNHYRQAFKPNYDHINPQMINLPKPTMT